MGDKMLIIADKIKMLRQSNKMSQSELAKKLGITRSSINAWELGLNIPSTQYILKLSNIFKVSSDYLLSNSQFQYLDVSDLDESDIDIVYRLIYHLRNKNRLKDLEL